MNVKTVKLNRKYNLGGYETLDVGYEAELTQVEGDDNQKILEATKELEKLADTYYTMVRFTPDKKTAEEKPVAEQSKETPYAITKFPEHLQQHLSLKNGNVYTEYVSREKWSEINEAARELGYEYVGGKGSHWTKK